MLPVKICCIQSVAEARLAIAYGARSLGLVSEMPTGWGPVPEERIAEIAAVIPPMVDSVLLSSKTNADAVARQLELTRCNTVQIVDRFPLQDLAALRKGFPALRILKAVHVTGEESIDAARELAEHVHCLVLDTGGPGGQLGGTGLTHDWSISARIVQAVSAPVLLAGGLRAHNVQEAIRTVRPYGLDLCTGVRSGEDYVLDEAKLAPFMEAVAGASRQPPRL